MVYMLCILIPYSASSLIENITVILNSPQNQTTQSLFIKKEQKTLMLSGHECTVVLPHLDWHALFCCLFFSIDAFEYTV